MPPADDRTPSRRRMLGYLGLAAAATAPLAACTGGAGISGQVDGQTGDAIDVRRFGAKGDGTTDDGKAIGRAFSALDPGQTLLFPARHVFCHSTVLKLATPGTRLIGPGTLLATNEENSALILDSSEIRVQDLVLAIRSTTRRWEAAEQHKLYLGPHAGIELTDVRVTGSAASGLYSYGASDFRFSGLRVSDTRADGIHLTNGTRNGVVSKPRVSRSGDDGVAVVSYLQDPEVCRDITVDNPVVRTTTGGRGVSVVGGHDISYRNIDITESSAAAIYLACEGGDFVTHPTERVTVSGGRVAGANTDTAIDHGAVLVYSGRAGGSVSDVNIANLRITATRTTASRQIGVVADGPDDGVSKIGFRNLQLATEPSPYQGNAPTSAITLTKVTAAGTAVRIPA